MYVERGMLTPECCSFTCRFTFYLQIYFLPDSTLSPVPFSAFPVGDRFLIERAFVAQAASLRTLDCARKRWDDISSSDPQSSPEVGLSGGATDWKYAGCISSDTCILECVGVCVCVRMQVLVISSGELSERQAFPELRDLNRILLAETDPDDAISKEELIKRVTGGSASLIHFLGHGTSVGKTTSCYRCRNLSRVMSTSYGTTSRVLLM